MKQLYIPITKVDATQRMVYGTMALETADKSGEILDYEGSKPYFEQWSQGQAAASGGKSFGNVRAMHGKVAAGLLAQPISYDDAGKKMDCAAKVVDDAEWAKVESGVYTGFSIGGKYVKRWTDGELARYIAEPFEVSLVDNPCIPGAVFQVIKADGATEDRPFASVQPTETDPPMTTEAHIPNDALFAKAEELAKAADSATPTDFLDAAREALSKADEPVAEPDPEAETVEKATDVEAEAITAPEPSAEDRAVEQVWKSRDGETFAKKADAISHNMKLAKAESPAAPLTAAADALAAAVHAATEKAAGGPAAPEGAEPAAEVQAAQEGAPAPAGRRLAKSMYDVARLAALLMELAWVQDCLEDEAEWEGDNSPVPAKLKTDIADLVQTLQALTVEESNELLGDTDDDDDAVDVIVVELSAHDGALAKVAEFVGAHEALAKHVPLLEKVGARNSKKDAERVQAVHDHAAELGAKCAEGSADKAAEGDLAKHDRLAAENAELRTEMEKVIGMMGDLTKQVQALADAPAVQPPRSLHVVDKSADQAAAAQFLKDAGPEAIALALFRDAQSRPQQAFSR